MRTYVCALMIAATVAAAAQDLSYRPESATNQAEVAQQLRLSESNVTVQSDGTVVLKEPAEGWMSHQVQPKETLWRIARHHKIPLDVFKGVNGLKGDKIKIGQELTIPRPSAPTASNTPTTRPSPTGAWVEVTTTGGQRAWVQSQHLMRHSRKPQSGDWIVETARQWLGTPYRWGGLTPNGADCSGFIHELFRLGGHQLPRMADEQYAKGERVKKDELKPGDLVFFETYTKGPSHVGVYESDSNFIHASSSKGVVRSSLEQPYYRQRFLGARRLKGL